jgi:hypothetical protein
MKNSLLLVLASIAIFVAVFTALLMTNSNAAATVDTFKCPLNSTRIGKATVCKDNKKNVVYGDFDANLTSKCFKAKGGSGCVVRNEYLFDANSKETVYLQSWNYNLYKSLVK